jgi:hypothetical protein
MDTISLAKNGLNGEGTNAGHRPPQQSHRRNKPELLRQPPCLKNMPTISLLRTRMGPTTMPRVGKSQSSGIQGVQRMSSSDFSCFARQCMLSQATRMPLRHGCLTFHLRLSCSAFSTGGRDSPALYIARADLTKDFIVLFLVYRPVKLCPLDHGDNLCCHPRAFPSFLSWRC